MDRPICIQCGIHSSRHCEEYAPSRVFCSLYCQRSNFIRGVIPPKPFDFPTLFYHCTSIDNLKNIFKYAYLYTQSDRIKLGISAKEGEGSLKRKSFDPKSSLQKGLETSMNMEAEGIYFRVVPPNCIDNSVALVFDQRILSPNNWHINTEENNGFYIDIPGKKNIAPWGGSSDGGVTYDSSNEKDYPFKLDENPAQYHELIVHTSVPLVFLKGVLANAEQAKKIRKLGLNINIISQ